LAARERRAPYNAFSLVCDLIAKCLAARERRAPYNAFSLVCATCCSITFAVLANSAYETFSVSTEFTVPTGKRSDHREIKLEHACDPMASLA
jgi:hypothetical protein